MSRSGRRHGRGSREQRLAKELDFYLTTERDMLEKCKQANTLDEKREFYFRAQRCRQLVAKYAKQIRACKRRCRPAPESPLFQFKKKEI